MSTRIASCFAIMWLIASFPGIARAAGGTTLNVQVVGAAQAPASGAEVAVQLGSTALPSLRRTDKSGTAQFENLSAGIYTVRVIAAGYQHAVQTLVLDGRYSEMTVRFALTLKVITTVHAHVSVVSKVLSRSSGLGRLSVSLADMLNRFGDARVQVSADGSLVGVSLQGKDPSLTSENFNGVTLQNAADIQALAPDLLSSAQTNDERNEVVLQTISSAPFPIYDFTGSINGFSGMENKAQIQNTAGAVGYAAVVDQHHQDSALNGASYADTSGLDYTHYGGYSSLSALAYSSVPINDDWTASMQLMRRRAAEIPIPTYLTGRQPTGFGPGNVEHLGTTAESLKISGTAQDWMLYGGYVKFARSDYEDYSHRYVAGAQFPQTTTTTSDTNAFSVSAIHTVGTGGTLNLNGSLSLNAQSIADRQQAFVLPPSQRQSTRSMLASAEYGVHVNPALFVDDTVQFAARAGSAAQRSLRNDASINVRANAQLNIFASFGGGSKIGLTPDLQPFVTPVSAQYDCSADTVIAAAPNPPPSTPSDFSARGGITLSKNADSLSLQLYRENYDGLTLTDALVPASSEPAGFAPSNYVEELQQGYEAYGGCSPLPTPATVYFEHDVGGLAVSYSGAEMVYGRHFRHGLSVQASFDYHKALLSSASALLASPKSVYIAGRQLPNVPELTAGLTIDDVIHSRNEIIVNASWTSSNNDHNLPAYCLWTAGFVRALSPVASVSLIATNIAHTYVGLFNTPAFAVPLPSYGGRLGTVATPLVEPQLYANLNIHVERQPAQP